MCCVCVCVCVLRAGRADQTTGWSNTRGVKHAGGGQTQDLMGRTPLHLLVCGAGGGPADPGPGPGPADGDGPAAAALIRALVEGRADPGLGDWEFDRTPLHYAVLNRRAWCLRQVGGGVDH